MTIFPYSKKVKSVKGETDTYQQNQLCEQYKTRLYMSYDKTFLSTILINGTKE